MNPLTLEETITKAASIRALSLTEEDKKVIIGAYSLLLYKATVELLLAMAGNKQDTHEKIQNLFNSLIENLTPEEQNKFSEILEKEKARILIEIFSETKDH